MCPPEDIPEDKKESYLCPDCPAGNITQTSDNVWECDTCNFRFDNGET